LACVVAKGPPFLFLRSAACGEIHPPSVPGHSRITVFLLLFSQRMDPTLLTFFGVKIPSDFSCCPHSRLSSPTPPGFFADIVIEPHRPQFPCFQVFYLRDATLSTPLISWTCTMVLGVFPLFSADIFRPSFSLFFFFSPPTSSRVSRHPRRDRWLPPLCSLFFRYKEPAHHLSVTSFLPSFRPSVKSHPERGYFLQIPIWMSTASSSFHVEIFFFDFFTPSFFLVFEFDAGLSYFYPPLWGGAVPCRYLTLSVWNTFFHLPPSSAKLRSERGTGLFSFSLSYSKNFFFCVPPP